MMFDQHSLKACLAIWCVHQSLWHRDDDLHPNDHVAFYAKHVDMIVALRERESVNLQPPPPLHARLRMDRSREAWEGKIQDVDASCDFLG